MDITPIIPSNKNLINAYAKDYVIINQQKYPLPLLISPDQIFLKKLEPETLQALDYKPEILLIGHQQKQMLLPLDLTILLKKLGINAETMDFGAACRTYNVLLAEGRNVATWII